MDLNEYLDSLGLAAEDRAILATTLGKAGDKATAPMLMRADYTKKTQELATERTRIANETAALNQQLTKALTDLETGRTTQAQYQARLERIQDEYGIDQSDLLTKKAPVSTESAKPAVDPALMGRLEQAERNYAIAPRIAAVLADAQLEYQRTFGNLDGFSAEKLMDHAEAEKLPLKAAFERLYKVPEKKHELLVQQITAKANAEADARTQQRIDQMLVGNATGDRNPNNWASNGSHLLSKEFRQNQVTRIEEGAKAEGRTVERPPSESRSAAESEIAGGGAAFARAFMNRRAKGVGYGVEERSA